MSVYPELECLPLHDLIACFQKHPPEGEEYAFLYYSEVASLIAAKGSEGIAFLQSQIKNADTARLRSIVFALAETLQNEPALQDLLVSYLEDERPTIVAEATDGLCRQGEKDMAEKVLAKLKHPSPYVRGSVLRFMARLHPDKVLPLLIEAFHDPDFIVRENAADELGELGAVEAIPYLRPFLEDSHLDVRQAAKTAIAMLSE